MTKNIIALFTISSLIFTSCKNEKPVEASIPSVKTETQTSEVTDGSVTDSAGNVLKYHSTTEDSLTVYFKNDTIELTRKTAASGNNYSNDNYIYTEWHGTTILEKDSVVIFKAGENNVIK